MERLSGWLTAHLPPDRPGAIIHDDFKYDTVVLGPAAFGPTALPGNLTREEIVQRYAARSGRAVDDVVFHYVLGLFKVAVIAQQIYFRYRQGLTQDERFAGLGFAVALLAQLAVRAVDRIRISGLLD